MAHVGGCRAAGGALHATGGRSSIGLTQRKEGAAMCAHRAFRAASRCVALAASGAGRRHRAGTSTRPACSAAAARLRRMVGPYLAHAWLLCAGAQGHQAALAWHTQTMNRARAPRATCLNGSVLKRQLARTSSPIWPRDLASRRPPQRAALPSQARASGARAGAAARRRDGASHRTRVRPIHRTRLR